MATPQDPFQQFLSSIGAARLDSAGRPVGSTGGSIAINQDQEQQLRSFQQPQGMATAGAPAQGGNPLAKLNSQLGLNIGSPYEGSALRQATDSLPATTQIAGAFGQLDETRKAAMIAQRIRDAGINLDPTQPGFEGQKRAAELIYNRMAGGVPSNSFIPETTTAYAPTGLRDEVLWRGKNDGGSAAVGFGGVRTSYDGTNAAGGNRFFMTSGPKPPTGIQSRPVATSLPKGGPSPAAMDFLRTGVAPEVDVAAPVVSAQPMQAQPAQQGERMTPLQAEQARYRQAVASLTSPKPKIALEPGFQEDPNNPGSVRPIPGSKAEQDRQAAAIAGQEKEAQAFERANGVIEKVNEILPQLNSMTTGVVAAATRNVPGMPAFKVEELKRPIQAALTVATLQDMRNASKNGASGFGNLTEKELLLLNSAVENLNTAQDEKAVRKALSNVRNSFIRWKAGYDAGRLDPNDQGGARRIAAVKWALANPNDARAEKILMLEQ